MSTGRRIAIAIDSQQDVPLARALGNVAQERARQELKWGPQHHFDGTKLGWQSEADHWKRYNDMKVRETGDTDWTSILAEEFFEALAETDQRRLRAELIQVAAVAVAWVEDIDSRGTEKGSQ